jgi:hypothetical protein
MQEAKMKVIEEYREEIKTEYEKVPHVDIIITDLKSTIRMEKAEYLALKKKQLDEKFKKKTATIAKEKKKEKDNTSEELPKKMAKSEETTTEQAKNTKPVTPVELHEYCFLLNKVTSGETFHIKGTESFRYIRFRRRCMCKRKQEADIRHAKRKK